MKILTSFAALCSELGDTRVVVVEGARCAGKDHLIARLAPHGGYQVYEALKPRKQFLDTSSGSLRDLPAGLDIQQSHLWSLDVLRQIDVKVLVNRAMLSSQYFDGKDPARMDMWVKLLGTVGGKVVLVSPPQDVHSQRIRKAGRNAEAESIFAERNGINALSSGIPGLLVFSERSLTPVDG